MSYMRMRTTAKIVGGGKVTVPAPIRDALDVDDGDLVEIDVKPVEPSTQR